MIPGIKRFCETCIFCHPTDDQFGNCTFHNIPQVDLKEDFCSWHKRNIKHCDICGSAIFNAGLILRDKNHDEFKVVCRKCYEKLHTCYGCQHRQAPCKFEDRSYKPEIPVTVQQKVEMPQGVYISTVPNEERQKQICIEENCPCWDKGNQRCARPYIYEHFCPNHKELFD